MEKKLTSQQIENTRMAYAIMAGFPAHKISLSNIRRSRDGNTSDEALIHGCGTGGCVAGVLSAHPYFKEQGFHWNDFRTCLKSQEGVSSLTSQEQELFGSWHIFDGGYDGIQGKREALERIREHLVEHKIITKARSRELAREERAMTM